MSVEIILHNHNRLCLGIMLGHHLHESGVICFRPLPANIDEAPASQGLNGDEYSTNAVPFILVALTLGLTGCHGQWHQDIANQLTRSLINADQRTLGVISLLVQIQDVFHPPQEQGGQYAQAPLAF